MADTEFISAYHRDGVLRRRGLFLPGEVAEIRRAFGRYDASRQYLPVGDFTLESDGQTVRNYWRMQDHDPYFRSLAERPVLLDLVAPLVRGMPQVMGVESFNKPAAVGSPVPWHQDNAYFCQSPPDVLTVWVALDPATEENGAVEYLLGSHHDLFSHVPSGIRGNSFGIADNHPLDGYRRFLGTVDPGDVLVHHCQTIHGSQPNRSSRPRLSLVIVYRANHTRTDPTLQAEYHRAVSLTPPGG